MNEFYSVIFPLNNSERLFNILEKPVFGVFLFLFFIAYSFVSFYYFIIVFNIEYRSKCIGITNYISQVLFILMCIKMSTK